MNNKIYRHGDIALVPIEKLPEGLTKSKSKIIIKSSGGNPHSIDKGEIYFKDVNQFVFGYLVAKNTTLLHPEHGIGEGELRKAVIEDGVYEIRRQQEGRHEGMTPVID